MDLSVIFVNWNSTAYLSEAIASIYANTTGIRFEIIVVDNASPVRDVGSVQESFPEVVVLKSEVNLGFARANNLGFSHSHGRYVLLLNPDTKLVGPAITTLMERIAVLPGAGIVGARHISPDRTVQTTSIQRFPRILNQILNIEYLRLRWPAFRLWSLGPLFSDITEPVQVEVIPGACMLMRREVFQEAGMFTPDFFMYGEDIDLNFKTARLGLKNFYIPDAVIIHYGGVSSRQQKVSEWATTMKFCAMTQYYTRNHGRAYAAAYRSAMAASALVRLLAIGLVAPVGSILRRQQSLYSAAMKWRAILRWALGLEPRALEKCR